MIHWTDTRFTKGTIVFCGIVIITMCLYVWGGIVRNVLLGCPDCPDAVVDTVTSTSFKVVDTVFLDPVLVFDGDSSWVEYPCSRIIDSPNRRLSGMVSIAAVDSILLHGGVWTIFDGDTAIAFMWKTWRQWQQARGL